jgi:hypothetical protein
MGLFDRNQVVKPQGCRDRGAVGPHLRSLVTDMITEVEGAERFDAGASLAAKHPVGRCQQATGIKGQGCVVALHGEVLKDKKGRDGTERICLLVWSPLFFGQSTSGKTKEIRRSASHSVLSLACAYW